MKRNLKSFCYIVFLIFSFTAIADIAAGRILGYMLLNVRGTGDLCLSNLAVNVIKTPVVIVGSSRASHHYNTLILTDSLHEKVYNVGVDGCFFSHNCCVINSIIKRYTPKLLIWEFNPSYLYEHPDDITSMYPYYGSHDYITSVVNEEVGWEERVRLLSNLYRYNSSVQRVLLKYYQNIQEDPNMGYDPIKSEKMSVPLTLKEISYDSIVINHRKLLRFKNTIKAVQGKGIKIILFDSPRYQNIMSMERSNNFKKICKDLDISFIDMSQHEAFLKHPDFFSDAVHLNEKGATLFTQLVYHKLQELYYSEFD